MDKENVIEAQRALRDEAVLLIIRERGVKRRLLSRWAYLRDIHADIEQDVYLHLLELWEREDKRDMVRECMANRQTLAAVVDMITKKALAKYGRDIREAPAAGEEVVPFTDLAEEVASLAQLLPTKERKVYEQWLDHLYNCQTLANMHGVSKAWMCKYIASLNNKIRQLWEQLY